MFKLLNSIFMKLTHIIKSDFLEVSLSTNFKLHIFICFRNYKYQTSDCSVVSLSKHFNFLISNSQKFTNTNNPNFRNYHFRNISSFGFLLVQKFINTKKLRFRNYHFRKTSNFCFRFLNLQISKIRVFGITTFETFQPSDFYFFRKSQIPQIRFFGIIIFGNLQTSVFYFLEVCKYKNTSFRNYHFRNISNF